MNDPLSALRPLHTPSPIDWWPPAPGWWLVLLLVATISVLIFRYWRRMAPQRAALRELKQLKKDFNTFDHPIATLNQLLKRYALVCWSATTVASLSGKNWLEFLDSTGGNGQFTKGSGHILLSAPYRQSTAGLDELTTLARQWIKANQPRKNTDV